MPSATTEDTIAGLLDALWANYTEVTPLAARIHGWLGAQGDTPINDHIALRTWDAPGVDRAALARPFEALGWRRRDEYQFPDKHVVANHWQHPDASLPKVFISELRVGRLPAEAQRIVADLLGQMPHEARTRADLPWSGRPWQIRHAQYQTLLMHSEYAAWVAAFGFRVNHFTVLVNALRSVASLRQLCDALQAAGFLLTTQGGVIKGSPAELLEQASTRAEPQRMAFIDGEFAVPSCYYEFAQRHADARGELFQGFVPTSANQLFHSTDVGPGRTPAG